MSKLKVFLLMAIEGLVVVFCCALLDIEMGLVPMIIVFIIWEVTRGLHKKEK